MVTLEWHQIDFEGRQLRTVSEVAAYLRVCTATVYRLCERGELEHFRVSNSIRVTSDALADFVAWKRHSRAAAS